MLPAILPNWRLERFADGVGLVPPGGRVLGGIRIREGLRLLQPMGSLFRQATVDLALCGGEYAGISTLTGTSIDPPRPSAAGKPRASIAGRSNALRATFATGRPDWSAGGTAICLHQLL